MTSLTIQQHVIAFDFMKYLVLYTCYGYAIYLYIIVLSELDSK